MLVLAAVYVVTAKFGIEQPVAHGVITPVWAPSGIAIAALLAFGPRLWPGIALGAFIANATSDISIAAALGICVGNTAEALVAAFLLNRVGFRIAMERVRDVIAFVALGAIVSTAISATFGVTSLSLAGDAVGSDYLQEWLLWWFGDLIGALLVAPMILVWISHIRRSQRVEHPLEAIVLLSAVGFASILIFLGGHWQYPALIFPLLVWAALRVRQIGTTTTVFVVGALATWGTVHGSVPIGGATPTESVQILQGLLAVVAIAVYVIASTLSERDSAESEAREAFLHLQEAQKLAHVGSWEWDVESGEVAWSDELYRIYGYEPQSFGVTYEKAMERVVDADRPSIEANTRAGFEAGADNALPVVQYRVVHPDGTTRTLRGQGVMRFQDGLPIRVLGTVQDVTEVVEAEAALADAYARAREAAERLRELDATKNTFISAAAHDLRAPLSTISGFASALTQRFPDFTEEQVRDMISRMGANADRMARMLANLLDLDRLEHGDVRASFVEIDLSDTVLRIVHGLESDRDVEVDSTRVTAWADEGLIERVIENLVLNAFRHTAPDTPVRVKVKQTSDGAEIAVEDEGPGIPDEMKDTIFQAFRRGENETSMGTGLGLFLVSEFAKLHDGRAWVEDRVGGGAVFKVFLPHRTATAAGTVA